MISQTSIARKLNLSQRTVSLCLAGSDRVAEATRKRVVETAQELGYRPNRSALSMRTGRFNAIALLQSTHLNYSFLPEQLLVGLQEGLTNREMHLVLASVPDEKLTDGKYLPSVLREWSVDGFLVNYNYGFAPRLVEVIEESDLPSIWLNSKRAFNCVYPDDIGGGRMITERLLALGHKRIVFFSHRRFEEHYSVGDRFAGYEQAMTAAGLPSRKLYFSDPEWDDATNSLAYVKSFLEGPERPTAVVTYETFEASRVLLMAFKMGLDVPRDLSVTTFHDQDARNMGIPITTMQVPEAAQGHAALELLLDRIESGAKRLPSRAIEFTTVSGESIAPPAK